MESIEGKKLINKMQQELLKSGIVVESLVKSLQTLRPIAIEENNPTLTKVIRLTYEHLESYDAFDIPIPADDVIDEFEEEQVEMVVETVTGVESLNYLLSLMADDTKASNREDLIEYRDMLMNY